jgi:N utilization substance protein B
MPARSKARKRALDVLFESEQRGLDPLQLLAERGETADPPIPPYAAELVRGVVAHRERLDELISTYTQSWPLERMPSVDRAVLRLGAYELLFVDDVPDAVALSEAVLLARQLSTDDSPAFVNGLLARLLTLKPTLSL